MARKKKRKLKKTVRNTLIAIVITIFLYQFASPYIENLKNIEEIPVENVQKEETKKSLHYDDVSSLQYTTTTMEERLENLKKQDERINSILEQKEKYPIDLLDMLSRNIEMLDFVFDFPQQKGKVENNKIEEAQKGIVPLLLQWDKRWGYARYGDSYLAINGCAPTTLSMVITGLTGKDDITPYTVSKYAFEQGYYINGTGTSWDLMTKGSEYFGIKGEELTLSKRAIYRALESGELIICSVRKGDFTTTGHFIVLSGIQNGKIKVNDPNSLERSSILWEYERIESQIKNLWVFSLE